MNRAPVPFRGHGRHGRKPGESRTGGRRAPCAAAASSAAPELIVDSLDEYLRAWWKRIRSGESGVLPIVVGLVLIVVIFQTQASTFLTAGNIVNLFVQAAVFVLLGLAETFALLLSEIDLSAGYVAAVGSVRDRRAPRRAEQLALVGRHPGRVRCHRGDRSVARHADHQAPPAVLRRHPGRTARSGKA